MAIQLANTKKCRVGHNLAQLSQLSNVAQRNQWRLAVRKPAGSCEMAYLEI